MKPLTRPIGLVQVAAGMDWKAFQATLEKTLKGSVLVIDK